MSIDYILLRIIPYTNMPRYINYIHNIIFTFGVSCYRSVSIAPVYFHRYYLYSFIVRASYNTRSQRTNEKKKYTHCPSRSYQLPNPLEYHTSYTDDTTAMTQLIIWLFIYDHYYNGSTLENLENNCLTHNFKRAISFNF